MRNVIEYFNSKCRYSSTLYTIDTYTYITKKMTAMHKFFGNSKIDCVVVGISGGIDSAVVLGILKRYMDMPGSHLKKIVPVIAPITKSNGVTGQDESTKYALQVCENFGFSEKDIILKDLSGVSSEMVINNEKYNDNWVVGQMNSILRTPLFYYVAANQQAMGFKSLVVGTINKSEGSYIGFFGKGSDGMNDLQIISDIYKYEVYEVAKSLGGLEEIIKRTPQGDVHDSKNDEEMIGASYDMLDSYLLFIEYSKTNDVNDFGEIVLNTPGVKRPNLAELSKFIGNIEKRHKENQHKYEVGMPCHFLNVFGSGLKDGWDFKYYNDEKL